MQPHTNYPFLSPQLALGKKNCKGLEAIEKCGWIEITRVANKRGKKKNIKRMKGT